MKYIKNITLSAFLVFTSFGVLATRGLGVITITTDEPVKYMKWITNAVPVFKEAWGDNVGAFGICSPSSGAQMMGEHFIWSVSPSLSVGYASSNDVYLHEPSVREINKIVRSRTVERRDTYGIIKNTVRVYGEGETTAQYNLLSRPESVQTYIKAIGALEAAAAENGFDDIEMAVFEASGAGDRAGMVIASVQAPNLSRLGAFMDQRWSSWMADASQEFPTLRVAEHEWIQTCTTLYSSN